jgi:hypothetical protein
MHKAWRDQTINRNLSKIVNLYSGSNKIKDSVSPIHFNKEFNKKNRSFAKLRRKTMAFLPEDHFEFAEYNPIEEQNASDSSGSDIMWGEDLNVQEEPEDVLISKL